MTEQFQPISTFGEFEMDLFDINPDWLKGIEAWRLRWHGDTEIAEFKTADGFVVNELNLKFQALRIKN